MPALIFPETILPLSRKAPLMSPINPTASLISGYCQFQIIGTGGFSTVYRATALDSGETVAIKVGRIVGQPETPETLRRLHAVYENEWNALNLIHSEDVVRPIARGTTDRDRPYLVLEYVDGVTLSDYQQQLAAGLIPFDLRQVLILMLSAAKAMGAMHENGLIHNDIKLSNYRLTGKGHVVLCDLGMALTVEEARRVGSRSYRGTPGYIPAQTAETPRKDVFALSAAFFHLLTGKRAFNPDNPMATFLFAPPPPSRIRPERNIPPKIDRIILKALSPAPADRYPDAIAMHSALEKAAQPIIGAKSRRPLRPRGQ